MSEVCAYIVMEVETGSVKEVLAALKKIKAVDSVCVVTGPFDIIAHITASSLKELGDTVTEKIQGINGLIHTTTCVCTHCECTCTCPPKK
ncbi:MAG TPA: Lrp/AsnC ligand binding domain-containing protein [Candidatus Wallbacteria bacterium]|nr:Lrp/AsnC ligand binding domain-containing protein [Candidatus Wallbacteria bacterium]